MDTGGLLISADNDISSEILVLKGRDLSNYARLISHLQSSHVFLITLLCTVGFGDMEDAISMQVLGGLPFNQTIDVC